VNRKASQEAEGALIEGQVPSMADRRSRAYRKLNTRSSPEQVDTERPKRFVAAHERYVLAGSLGS
jgi:hypothetical protein